MNHATQLSYSISFCQLQRGLGDKGQQHRHVDLPSKSKNSPGAYGHATAIANNNSPLILFPGYPEESQSNSICLLANCFLFLQDSFRLLGTKTGLTNITKTAASLTP